MQIDCPEVTCGRNSYDQYAVAASWEANLPSMITALQMSPDGKLAVAGDYCGNV